jgi:hypothetical protein
VAHGENVRREAARWVPAQRQRAKRWCPGGRSYTKANTYVQPEHRPARGRALLRTGCLDIGREPFGGLAQIALANGCLYRSRIERVLCPLICRATRSGMPALTMLRTAERRRGRETTSAACQPLCRPASTRL